MVPGTEFTSCVSEEYLNHFASNYSSNEDGFVRNIDILES